MEKITEFIDNNRQRFLDELFGLIRIPSISSLTENKPDMLKAAEYWKDLIRKAGADRIEILQTEGNPVVYGEKIIDPKLQTVLVYGHYDVMPVDPLDLWETKPFEPVVKNEKIYARGADDDKGQAFMHAKAFEFMVKTNKLPCNVKFMIEGEEEIGSPSLEKFCNENKELLKCDIILVSDTGMIAPDIPSITVGLRGLAYMEVEIIGPNRDLHSGIFGGAVANPANVLSKLIAQLTDENNKITIPGFYDDVIELTSAEREDFARAPFNIEKYKQALDLKDVSGEKGFSTIERTGIRPSLDVNGIWSGYTGEGAKTVLPSKATAKISMRLVPNQDHHKISKLFEEYLLKIAPPSVKITVKDLHGGSAYAAPTNTKAYEAASKAYQKTFGKIPVPTRSGGSIPVIAMFEKVLGAKSILMGFGLESDAIHSPNENYPLFNFFKGIETIPWFYYYYCNNK